MVADLPIREAIRRLDDAVYVCVRVCSLCVWVCVCGCAVREGQKSPGVRRRRRPHDKSSESSSLSSSTVNHVGSDKENVRLDERDDVNNDHDDEMEDDVKTDREIEELSKMTDSGAAKVILEDLRKKKLEKTVLDPRSSSRTPSAAAEPPYRPRYDSPMFACKWYTCTHIQTRRCEEQIDQIKILKLTGKLSVWIFLCHQDIMFWASVLLFVHPFVQTALVTMISREQLG